MKSASSDTKLTLDFVLGIFSIIQNRTREKRSINSPPGFKNIQQLQEIDALQNLFPNNVLKVETMRIWFSNSYGLILEFYKQVSKLSSDRALTSGARFSAKEMVDKVHAFFKTGVEIEDSSQRMHNNNYVYNNLPIIN